MNNGYIHLKNTAQFGLDLIEYYKNTDDEWAKNNALLSMLGVEDLLDRGRSYCENSEQKQEINQLMDRIRSEIAKIRDSNPQSFKNKLIENSERLKSQF